MTQRRIFLRTDDVVDEEQLNDVANHISDNLEGASAVTKFGGSGDDEVSDIQVELSGDGDADVESAVANTESEFSIDLTIADDDTIAESA